MRWAAAVLLHIWRSSACIGVLESTACEGRGGHEHQWVWWVRDSRLQRAGGIPARCQAGMTGVQCLSLNEQCGAVRAQGMLWLSSGSVRACSFCGCLHALFVHAHASVDVYGSNTLATVIDSHLPTLSSVVLLGLDELGTSLDECDGCLLEQEDDAIL